MSLESETIAFHMIERAADNGLRCPTNDEISHAIGALSPATGNRAVASLEAIGLIKVERGNNARVATIVETGKRTAGEVGKPHWRALHPPKKRPQPIYTKEKAKGLRETSPPCPPVQRDPCPRCGTRADIGCSHGWQP